ncbi:MAG: hypothetical protein KGI66_03540 [Patescibacteria group bacterium]|nr:hypothetical protein [Patescibacteria group bacterium]
MNLVADERLLSQLAKIRKENVVGLSRDTTAGIPQLHVEVPKDWPKVTLAPLFDVHIGNKSHDAKLFERHVSWIAETPYVLTFNGGDLIENASKYSVGAGVYEQDYSPDNQLVVALEEVASIAHKTIFALPGNHEDRSYVHAGLDVGRWISALLEVPYYSDYCFCTIHFGKQNFHLLAYHGCGGSRTKGGQVMSARRPVEWSGPVDILWSGHLHAPNVELKYAQDFDQKTGKAFERNQLIVISPSYMHYFGSYAAKKMFPPGSRGLTTVNLYPDGTMDTIVRAKGERK